MGTAHGERASPHLRALRVNRNGKTPLIRWRCPHHVDYGMLLPDIGLSKAYYSPECHAALDDEGPCSQSAAGEPGSLDPKASFQFRLDGLVFLFRDYPLSLRYSRIPNPF
jgi:hypothetical protein